MHVSKRGIVLAVIFFFAAGVFLVLQYGGELMRDIAFRGEPMQIQTKYRIVDAKCSRYYHLVSACATEYVERDATFVASGKFKDVKKSRFLVFGSVTGERVLLMSPKSRPDVVTTSAAIAHLSNRFWTLLLLAGFAFLLPLAIIVKALRSRGGGPTRTEAPQMAAGNSAGMDEMIARHMQAKLSGNAGARPPAPSRGVYSAGAPTGSFGRRGLAR
jgi:hypothetical protein